MKQIIGSRVSYLDDLLFPQIGTIIDYRPHKSLSDVLYLSLINDREYLNQTEYSYIDKIDKQPKTVLIDCIRRSDECNVLVEE